MKKKAILFIGFWFAFLLTRAECNMRFIGEDDTITVQDTIVKSSITSAVLIRKKYVVNGRNSLSQSIIINSKNSVFIIRPKQRKKQFVHTSRIKKFISKDFSEKEQKLIMLHFYELRYGSPYY